MNFVHTCWNWLSARSAWNVAKEVENTRESLRDKPTPHLMQKIIIGFYDDLKNIPRTFLILAIVGSIFPPKLKLSEKCYAFLKTYKPVPESFFSINNFVVGTFFEELAFRAGLQNLLQRLEHSSYSILRSLGSLKNRTFICSTLFATNHLIYYLMLDNPCYSINYRIIQTISCLFNANFTALYENYGIAASLSAHLIHNFVPEIIEMLGIY